jgi:hypothetical protein
MDQSYQQHGSALFDHSFRGRVCLKLLRGIYLILFNEPVISATCGDHITSEEGFFGQMDIGQVQEGMGGYGISRTCENHAREKLGRNIHQLSYLLGNPKQQNCCWNISGKRTNSKAIYKEKRRGEASKKHLTLGCWDRAMVRTT